MLIRRFGKGRQSSRPRSRAVPRRQPSLPKQIVLYTPGQRPQYGKARWDRYEELRVKGFTKNEARQLSRAHSPQALSVVENMVKGRLILLTQFTKIARERAYTGRMAYGQYTKFIKKWYDSHNLTTLLGRRAPAVTGGKPDVMLWYNAVENRMARLRGWRKGDPESPPRRDKRQTRPSPNHKGKVKQQKARARVRAKAFREAVKAGDSPSERKQKRDWIKALQNTAKLEPWREDALLEQARRLGYKGKKL